MTNKPLKLNELIDKLVDLKKRYPNCGGWPIHMLEMDAACDGLVTHVTVDCFDEAQGPVVSLLGGAP